eukprot:432271_1
MGSCFSNTSNKELIAVSREKIKYTLLYGYLRSLCDVDYRKKYVIPSMIVMLCLNYAYNVPLDSEILEFVEERELLDMLEKHLEINENNKLQIELLYRSSKDGLTADSYHKHCNGKESTLCIIQSEFNNVFGFYTPIIIANNSELYDDPSLKTFCYLIRSKGSLNVKKWNTKRSKRVLSQYPSDYFGLGAPFTIYVNGLNVCYSSGRDTFFMVRDDTILGGGENNRFKITNMEMFWIYKKN